MRLLSIAVLVCSLAAVAQPRKAADQPCDPKAAKEQLDALKERFDAMRGTQLSPEPKELKRSLTELTRQVNALVRDYTVLAGQKCGAVSIDAMVMMGRVYEEFAHSWLTAPVPAGLDEEQRALYKSELEGRAAPLRERARTLWADAVKAAKAQGVTDELVQQAQDALARSAAPAPAP